MIQLNLLVFLFILEMIVVFAILFVLFALRSRRLSAALAVAVSRVRALVKRPDARQYLLTEANMTADQVRALGTTGAEQGKILSLRAEFLQMEQMAAENPARDKSFREGMSQQIDSLLSQHEPPDAAGGVPGRKAGAAASHADGAVKTQELFAEQTSTIRGLKKQIRAALSDSASIEQLEKQIDKITSANQELSYCVATLESEIESLRGKIFVLEGKPGADPAGQAAA